VRLLAGALQLDECAREQLERVATMVGCRPSIAGADLPGQLPPDIADFTGRNEQAGTLSRLLARATSGPRVVVICGQPGVGTTALSVHVAHRLKRAFPDGQLYAELGEVGTRADGPFHVLGMFLHALGVEEAASPRGVEERMALYRTRTAPGRFLIVLDEASHESQVRPLLPAGAGCAALVTSLRRLPGLEAAHPVQLDVLEPGEAVRLLARIAGTDRVAAEPSAAAAIVERCGRLPLALRLAGAKLANRPHWTLCQFSERLDDERHRLDELNAGDLALRSRYERCYRLLEPDSQRAFRLLATMDRPGMVLPDLAARIGGSAKQAERLAEGLVDAQLLGVVREPVTGRSCYRMPELLRVFGLERAHHEDPAVA
jgi:hypothetical protein